VKIDTMLFGLGDAAERARRLEEMGVDGCFTFEGPHDPFVPLIRAAGHVDLDLMTNVAIALPRNPMQTAHLAWDLQTLSGGRFFLGLGTQIRPAIEKRYGAAWERPVGRMREFVAALRAIFACWQHDERLDFRGQFYTHTLMTPMFHPGALDSGPPPIYLGALGPQMTRLAAQSADGILVMPFNTKRSFTERTLPAIQAGLRAAGRDPDALAVVGEAIVCAGRTEEELAEADAQTRWLLAFYASTPSYRPTLEAEGWEDLQTELNAMTKAGRWAEMPDLIDETMLSTIAVRGTPKQVAAQIVDRFGGRCDRIGFYTPYAIADDLLAEVVAELRDLSNAPRPRK